MQREYDFPISVQRKLAERAAYICSNPNCPRLTTGPDNSNAQKSTKAGIAAHICAAEPGGARYNDLPPKSQKRKSITNGIWLCGTCSILIDKNEGRDYPTPLLIKWKADHEKLIKECLEGKRQVILYSKSDVDQTQTCKKILNFLEERGALFMDIQYEVPYHVYESIREIRTFLTQIQSEVVPETPLEAIVKSIIQACRHFMNTTKADMDMTDIFISLGSMRKMIGINLSALSKTYKVPITGDLKKILPVE